MRIGHILAVLVDSPERHFFVEVFLQPISEQKVVGLAEVRRKEDFECLGFLGIVGQEPAGLADTVLLLLEVSGEVFEVALRCAKGVRLLG